MCDQKPKINIVYIAIMHLGFCMYDSGTPIEPHIVGFGYMTYMYPIQGLLNP